MYFVAITEKTIKSVERLRKIQEKVEAALRKIQKEIQRHIDKGQKEEEEKIEEE